MQKLARLKLALEIGTYTTRLLVQKPSRQGMLISAFHHIKTPEGAIQQGEIRDEEALAETLKNLVKPYGARGDVFCSLEIPTLIHRQLLLPSVRQKEFHALIGLQLETMLSDSMKNFLIDYRINRTFIEDGTAKTAVTAFAAPRRIIEGYIRLFEKADIRPNILDVQPNCISKLFSGSFGYGTGAAAENTESIAVIDLGYGMTGIHILEQGELAFSRVLSSGTQSLRQAVMDYYQISSQEAERLIFVQADFRSEQPEILSLNRLIEESLDPVMAEVQRVFRFYSAKRQKKTLDKAFLTGGASHIKHFDDYLSGILNCRVELPGRFSGITFPEGLHTESIRDYVNCLGALVRSDIKVSRKEPVTYA